MVTDYENKFVFRLIKVSHYLCFIAGFLMVSSLAISQRPKTVVDRDKSMITCWSDGNRYSLVTTHMWGSLARIPLAEGDFDKGNEFCLNKLTFTTDTLSSGKKEVSINDIPKYKRPTVDSLARDGDYSYKFTINIVKKQLGGWDKVIGIFFIGITGIYVLLNLVRETLIYLFLGKKFDFSWLPRFK